MTTTGAAAAGTTGGQIWRGYVEWAEKQYKPQLATAEAEVKSQG